METLDTNILGTNKIPGSEKFTRPEEIKALSKYLKKIHATQDEHTSLGEESLALFGRKTGKLVDIEKLSDYEYLDKISDDSKFSLVDEARPMIENESEDVIDLLQKKIKLAESENEGSNVIKLDDSIERISDDSDISKLPTKSVEINPNEAPEDWTKKLLKDIVKLQGNNEITDLPTEKVDLNTPNRTIPLPTDKEELDVDNKVQSLTPYQKIEELTDLRLTSLSTEREDIVDHREIDLPGTKEELYVQDNTELTDYLDKISDERSQDLSEYREDIDVNQEIELPTDKELLETTDVNALSEHKEELNAEDVVDSLSDYFDVLGVTDEPSLSDYKETIEDKREASLSEYRESIDVSDIDSLSDKRLDLKDEREVELSNTKLEIKDEGDIKKLPNDSINILNNYGLSVDKLSDVKENIKESTTKSPDELSDDRLDILDDRESELDETKKKIGGDIPEIEELSEEKQQILEGKTREPDDLVDGKVMLNVDNLVENLPNIAEGLNPDNAPEINQLTDFIENLDVNTYTPLDFHREKLEVKEKVDKLEDGIFIIDNDYRPPIKLPTEKDKIKADENRSKESQQLHEFVDELSVEKAVEEIKHSQELDNTGLFNRVMKLLQDMRKDSSVVVGSQEWINKTEALVTSYFNAAGKQYLNVDPNGDEFIQNWIDSITMPSTVNRKPIPVSDPRQVDPENTQIIATSEDGNSVMDSFFSFLIKANSVEELSRLLKLYKAKLPSLNVPENSDDNGISYKNFKENLEDYEKNDDGKVVRAKILPATIDLLQDLIKERGGKVNISTPQDENLFDKNEYTLTSEGGEKTFDFIGALINTNSLDTFKELLKLHNTGDVNYDQRLGVKDIGDNFEWAEYITGTLFAFRKYPDANYERNSAYLSKYGITDDYQYNSRRPLHHTKDSKGNWVETLSDPLKDKDGNVTPGDFDSHKRLVTRKEYELPGNAQWGNLKKNIKTENDELNIFGIASMLSNPGANLNLNKYLRYTAEKLTDQLYKLYTKGVDKLNELNTGIPGVKAGNLAGQALTQFTGIPTNKRRMLEETLGLLVFIREKLEKVTKANRDRLPGDSIFSQLSFSLLNQGTKGLGDKLIGMAKKAITGGSTKYVRNRPTKGFDIDNARGTIFGASDYDNTAPKTTTIAFQDNKRGYDSSIGRFGDWNFFVESACRDTKSAGKSGVINLSKDRFSLPGLKTTLSELAGYDVSRSINSLEELKEILIKAPYITTPNKFGSNKNGFRSQTLSSNSFWEIKLEPFVHKNMNGGFSYLPSIREINVINLRNHGIYTGYNEWLPITSFELERAKLATKTLGIFEGEIVYPIGCEFLNELSITMINDSLKSWSSYWRRVMEVSTHNSEPHPASFYEDPFPIPTSIDHTAPIVALYKNITWRCQIYILSPQYSTLKKFDLLVVLKDFTESYTGEIDSPGNDVQLRFSVVGENPPEEHDFIDPLEKEDRDELRKVERAEKERKERKEEEREDMISKGIDPDGIYRMDPPKIVPTDPPPPVMSPVQWKQYTDKIEREKKSGKTRNSGNAYYAIEQSRTSDPHIIEYNIIKKTGDPNKDPMALIFGFDGEGKLMNAYVNAAFDNKSKSPFIEEGDKYKTNWVEFFNQEWYDAAQDEDKRDKTRDNIWEVRTRKHQSDSTGRG